MLKLNKYSMSKFLFKTICKYSWPQILQIIDHRYGLGACESFFASNWLNIFLTIYFNFRCFPFRQAIKLPIFIYGRPRLYNLSGHMEIKGKVSCGMIKFNNTEIGAPSLMSVQSEICNLGKIIFEGKGRIGTGNKIYVAQNAILTLGQNFKVMDMCNIGCYKKVVIGAESWITHRCQVFDSNYHYLADFVQNKVPPYRHTIQIGKGCWICNSSTIIGDVVMPDFTIVASNSLVNRNFSSVPNGSIIGGIPAKLLSSGFRRVDNSYVEKQISSYYSQNPDNIYSICGFTPEDASFCDKFR